jgi:hypothetical protein
LRRRRTVRGREKKRCDDQKTGRSVLLYMINDLFLFLVWTGSFTGKKNNLVGVCGAAQEV